uniref:Tr-type G domain-containing protein n=1 Tax=Setaria italica TaxID=4555 RepID=K3YYU2_SETIT
MAAAAAADPRLVRNTCILARVDHGKTSLADHLVASGGDGLLHPKLAGSAMFMDHLPEEQRRAITMKSSSVALRHAHPTGVHRVHLIDSPGHADFCSEVSAAARLSDSALTVVDAAKCVRVQTHAALRQAFVECLRPCLVLNKLDRLITDLLLSPEEAYALLGRTLAEVNSIYSALRSGSYFSSLLQDDDGRLAGGGGGGDDEDEDDGTPSIPTRETADQQPAFVQNVLKPLWKLYQRGLMPNSSEWMHNNVVSVFNQVSPLELHSKEPKVSLHAVLRAWLPLAESVMEMLVECTPDPVAAQAFRVPRLMPERRVAASGCASIVTEAEQVRSCVAACSTSKSAPVVVFVSKMFAVPYSMLPSKGLNGEHLNHNHGHNELEPDEECFLAFARVFSGVLRAGQKVFVLSPLYDPVKGDDASGKHVQEVELHCLYEMLGQDLLPVDSVAAGNVVAIQGLGQHVLKSATLSSTKNCWPFSSMTSQLSPMLKLLNQADPLVVYTVSQRGEHVLAAAGEVHLERCIKDLQERFANVQLEVSKPLVSFKETIQGECVSLMGSMKAQQGFVERTTPNGRFTVRVQVINLPNALTKVLAENEELLGQIIEGESSQFAQDGSNSTATLRQRVISAIDSEVEAISEQVEKEKLERCRKTLLGYLQRIMALGPSHVGPNFLLLPDLKSTSGVTASQNGWGGILVSSRCHVSERLGETQASTYSLDFEALRNSIVSGFQFATNAGPICDEPIRGVAFVVESYISVNNSDAVAPMKSSLQVITVVKEACREAVLQSKPRLVEPIYFCELTTPMEQVHAAFSVLRDLHAHLPVAESSEFAEKLRKRTSGAASAILAFSHWESISQDPFFTPKTQEETEEFGDRSSIGPNLAKKLMNSVRRRKGLHVEEKVVEHGTKQRTLARKV